MSDTAAFLVLGIVALAVNWPTWTWAVAFALAGLTLIAELGASS